MKYLIYSFFILFITRLAAAQNGDGLNYYVSAEKLRQENNFRAAIDMYDKAIKEEPTNYKYIFQKGKCYILLKDQENAIRCFEKTVELQKDFVQAYFRLAWLYRQKEKYNEAIKYFDAAFKYEKDPKEKLQYKDNILEILFKTDRLKEAGEHIKDAKSIAPDDIRILYFEAKYNNAIGKYDLAKSAMEKATANLSPENPEDAARYYFELGYALHKLGNYEKANEVFKKANYGTFKSLIAEMTPQFNFALAVSYYKVFEYKKAKEILDYTLNIDNSYSQAHDLLAKIAAASTDKTMVLEHKKTSIATERDPMRKAAKYRELCEMQFESAIYADAILSADECLKIQPKNYAVTFIKAMALYKNKDVETAKVLLSELVNYPGLDLETKAMYNFALGLICKNSQDRTQAVSFLKAASFGSFRYAATKELEQL
jgi:tetratricopeptide (TPR) repeat protein